ncbi:methyl-accepting chemotaxis protein [Clostridium sp. DJ247]|uniref:methyl-accepting chemotaxis protein n=1 Tax=Clostridium sp. DJ247 TaxID=2726188 RepID=UPI0016274155|nr:methyl-accepting chemotaxis protein [Clostridium sp. DJ247]MBC2580126.1 HAMP domain-containing protein [Clostridium sp. DJ247]
MKINNKLAIVFTSFAIIPLILSGGIIYFVNSSVSDLTNSNNTIVKTLLITMLIVGIISAVISIAIGKRISSPIEKMSDSMNRIAEGDFTASIEIEGKDEITSMFHKFTDTLSKIKDSLLSVKDTSSELGDSAATLSATSQEMLSATNHVTSSIQQVVTSVTHQSTEIFNAVKLLTNLAAEINMVQEKLTVVGESTKETEGKAVEGEGKIYELIGVIVNIKQSFDIVLQKIDGLSSTVSEIGKITDIISNISEQTNLLALNASIEAARAGEQGRGFTVVADEVRKLAEESKFSSEKIISLVKSITVETNDVMDNSSKVSGLLEEQAVVANDTIISFEEIISSMRSVPELIEETENLLNSTIKDNSMVLERVQKISESAQEVSAASEAISSSSEELLASSEEVAQLSIIVYDRSSELRSKVSTFKVQ